MNICLDARTVSDHFPGIGRYTFNLARALAPQLEGFEELIVLRDPAATSAWDLRALAGERVRLIDVGHTPFSLRQQWDIPRLLRAAAVDVYHSPYYLMPYRTGVPTLVTVHDLVPLRYGHYFTRTQRVLFAAAIRFAMRASDAVIAVSAATAADIEQLLRVPAKRIRVIPEAADPIFTPAPSDRVGALRARLGLPEQYVLCLGSNKPHKNLTRLVEAWAKLRAHRLQLVIAGVWDARYPQARRRAEALQLRDAVRFLGPVEEQDLPLLYGGATVVVFPSEYEGFGLPVIEAMACGAPVTCSHTRSLSEGAGHAAALFDPLDVDAMARTIEEVLADARRRTIMVERGLARAAQFSWDEAARLTLNAYREVAAPGS